MSYTNNTYIVYGIGFRTSATGAIGNFANYVENNSISKVYIVASQLYGFAIATIGY